MFSSLHERLCSPLLLSVAISPMSYVCWHSGNRSKQSAQALQSLSRAQEAASKSKQQTVFRKHGERVLRGRSTPAAVSYQGHQLRR